MSALDDLRARGRRRGSHPFDVDGTRVEVDFQALRPADYEALVTEFTGADGEVDRDGFLPALASACATQDGDADTWANLTSEVLSAGEANSLYQHLILLNYGIPGPGLGKG